jgi:hypothetical protein
MRGRNERVVLACPVPPTGLDARHRDPLPRTGGHEHCEVDGAVLLRALDLLALIEEHGDVQRVDDEEVVDRRRVELLHHAAVRRRLRERQVLERSGLPEHGVDRERAGATRLAERQVVGEEGGGRLAGRAQRRSFHWACLMESPSPASF